MVQSRAMVQSQSCSSPGPHEPRSIKGPRDGQRVPMVTAVCLRSIVRFEVLEITPLITSACLDGACRTGEECMALG